MENPENESGVVENPVDNQVDNQAVDSQTTESNTEGTPQSVAETPVGEPQDTITKDTCICGVCLYGRICPPISFHLREMPPPNHPIHEKVRRSNLTDRTGNRTENVIAEWEQTVASLQSFAVDWRKNDVHFVADNRGGFWKCVCCGCCVHEQCLDFVDHWCLYQDENFHCETVSLC